MRRSSGKCLFQFGKAFPGSLLISFLSNNMLRSSCFLGLYHEEMKTGLLNKTG